EPAAIVGILHPRDASELRRAVRIGATSQGAMAIRAWRMGELGFGELIAFFLHCLVKRPVKRWLESGKAPRRLIGSELFGVITSPGGYWRGRARPRAGPGPTRARAIDRARAPGEAPEPTAPANEAPARPAAPGAAPILVVRTQYPHWGRYSGMN